jgi:hypothetical protein
LEASQRVLENRAILVVRDVEGTATGDGQTDKQHPLNVDVAEKYV